MDNPFSISLVIPTVSRPTLARTLASIRIQKWEIEDEIILVGDGPNPNARILWNQFKLPGRYMETSEPLKFWGHGIRNWLFDQQLLKTRFVAALDDDDTWTPDALYTIKKAIKESPTKPHIFKMTGDPNVGEVWKVKDIRLGNIGTPMLVCPNIPDKLARYEFKYGGDCDFIKNTCSNFNNEHVWHREVICNIRPY